MAAAAKQVQLGESTGLLRRATQLSANYAMEPQIGALIQQIEYELNRRLAQRQAWLGEMEQLEGAASRARSLAGLSQLINQAHSVASAAAGDQDVAAALGQGESRGRGSPANDFPLLTEVNELADKALIALSVGDAEQWLADGQRRVSAHSELDDLQEIIVRVSAQVHGRRVEHDLVCEELGSLRASISQALVPAELDVIRQGAVQIRDKHAADPSIVSLSEQVESDVRTARAKLLQVELSRLSQDEKAEPSGSQLSPTETASLVKRLQELVKSFPESVELRGMLLRAEANLERAERARYEAAARASAIDLEIKTYTRLLESRQGAKALSAIEEAAAKYPESEPLQSLLLKYREQVAAEHEAQLQASAQKAALQAAIDKGTDLLKGRRFVEAGALLEVACQQWPHDQQLAKLLSAARKSVQRQAAEQQKMEQRQLQVAERPATRPRRILLISAAVALLLIIAGIVSRFVGRPHISVLTVTSSPAGAEIEVDGRKCITPNCAFKLTPGAAYSVKADLPGYVSSSRSVTLTNDQTISFELAEEAPPAPPVAPPVHNEAPAMARLMLKGARSGDQLFVDDIRVPVSEPPGTWDLTPGSHRLRLVAGNQELVADPRTFKANGTVILNRADFKPPAPATSQEQIDWKRVAGGGDIVGVEKFLRDYPNSPFRSQAEAKLENLYWSRANGSGSIRDLQEYAAKYASPAGPHLAAAQAEIARLGWEAIQNANDPSQIRRFLDQNPRGQYHDLAVNRLDDLTWAQAIRKDDAASVKGYLGTYPSGRHKEEAVTELARLTPAPPAPQLPTPPVPTPAAKIPDRPEGGDDLNAIRSVLDSYKSAYNTKDLAKLQEIWPGMSPRQVSGLRTAFHDAGKVNLTYVITKGPEVAGDVAVVTFEQQIVTNASAKSKVTMTLRKSGTQGSWHITSVR